MSRRPRQIRLNVEAAEPRVLMAAPVIDPIADVSVPAGKPRIVPITASDADGNPLRYTVSTGDGAQVTTTLHTANPFLKLNVQGYGVLQFELLRDLAPSTVDTLVGLVNRGFYNGLTFHRVVPSFVIQGGDPAGDGTGGPGFQFGDEFNPEAIFSGDGQLAMANSGKDTNGSQFFVTLGAQRFLDFNHTIWGQLVRGFDVLRAIDAAPTGANNRPSSPIVITSAAIVADTADAVITLDAKAGATGPTPITVTVDDGTGNVVSRTFNAVAATDATNDPPILGPVAPSFTTPVGTPISIPLSSIDLEGDPVELTALVTDATPHATATISGTTLTVTPAAGYTGDVNLLVRARAPGATSRGSSTNPYDSQATVVLVSPQTFSTVAVPIRATIGKPTGTISVARITPLIAATSADFTATIDWGDGTAPTPGGIVGGGDFFSGYFVIGDHTYARGGAYAVLVSITEVAHAYTSTTATTAAATSPAAAGLGDYDGDGKVDLALYRPATGQWLIQQSTAGPRAIAFGAPGTDLPVQGDYDGDGKTDLAVYRPTTSEWFIQLSGGGTRVVAFGGRNDTPVPADYDGDGKTDLAVYRPQTGQWFILRSSAGPLATAFGQPLVDVPVPADYDGDGKVDLAVYRPSAAQWLIQQSTAGPRAVFFGAPGTDKPVPADYDGDGKADLAVYRPSAARWLIQQSTAGPRAVDFGAAVTDRPIPGDFDGDGKADIAVYRPSTAQWLILGSTAGPRATAFGATGGDYPLPVPYVDRYSGPIYLAGAPSAEVDGPTVAILRRRAR